MRAAQGDPLFDGVPHRFQAMQWHYYACRPADGMTELMRNPVSLQALRVGDSAWGTQFHIEVTRTMLLHWLEFGGEDLEANGYPPDVFLRSLDEHLEDHERVGRTLAERFARVAAEKTSTRAAG